MMLSIGKEEEEEEKEEEEEEKEEEEADGISAVELIPIKEEAFLFPKE